MRDLLLCALGFAAATALVFFALAEDYDYCERHGGILVRSFAWYHCIVPAGMIEEHPR